MTGRWSSQIKKMEFKDLQATGSALAVDCTGRLALLAGRRVLGIVNLASNSDVPDIKKVVRQSKWDVSVAQWNPHKAQSNVFITACNQRADIWRWDDCKGTSTQQGSLKAHTRVISDLDWSPTDVNRLASCSSDAYTFLWDIRDTRKPAVSMQAVVGASQVKWNRVNSQLLATAHDGDIRIWDPRKSTAPVQYIAAHLSKIHGLDWCPSSEFHLASSSQDGTVKFWDINNPKSNEAKLASSSPVWRARYTPQGDGLATVMVPQMRRGENSLLLWDLNDLRQPVHTFMGHQDVVLEFQWRHLEDEGQGHQLVSWSRDQTLRIWKVESQPNKTEDEISIQVTANDTDDPELSVDALEVGIDIPVISGDLQRSPQGHHKVKDVKEVHLAFTPPRVGSFPKRDEMQSPQQPKLLQHEFALVNFHIPNVTIEAMDHAQRSFSAAAHINNNLVKLTMYFPGGYPYNQAPEFQFDDGTTVSQGVQEKLHKVLQETSLQHVKHGRPCIEPCLTKLVSCLEELTREQSTTNGSTLLYMMPQALRSQPFPQSSYYYGVQDPTPVPYPRTCGARFCGAGFLVCFTKPVDSASMRRTSSTVEATPRVMSSYSGFSQGSRTPQSRSIFSMAKSPPSSDTLIGFHRDHSYRDRGPRSRSRSRVRDHHSSESKGQDAKKSKTGPVVIYNIACLMPLNKQLAENYVLDETDVPAMCTKNATAAAAVGRRDLVQMWSLATLATNPVLQPDPDPDKGQPWAMHPFGRKFVNSLLTHYSMLHDVQTLAMLCCTFGSKFDPQKPLPSPKPVKQETVPNGDTCTPPGNLFHTSFNSSSQMSTCGIYVHDDDAEKEWEFNIGIYTIPTLPQIKRSSSWSNLSNQVSREEAKDPAQKEREKHQQNITLLDQNRLFEYDGYKRAYADLLYRWQLFNTRSEVLKYMAVPAEPHKGIEFGAECQACHKDVRGVQCFHCKHFALQCVICHMGVKGSSSFCLACGHGGHTVHMTEWFRDHSVCPTGCGCLCLEDNPMTTVGDS